MITREDLIELIRIEIGEGTQQQLAQRWRISPSYLADVLSGRRDPGKTILAALGFERLVFYQRIRSRGEV